MTPTKNHIGRKISRIRELRDMKQEALAHAMGISQQSVSIMENSEMLDEDKIVEVAKALGVTPEAIKNFSEENVINYFNNFYDNSASNGQGAFGPVYNFNPIEKLIEAYEENKRLYERLLEAEKRNK